MNNPQTKREFVLDGITLGIVESRDKTADSSMDAFGQQVTQLSNRWGVQVCRIDFFCRKFSSLTLLIPVGLIIKQKGGHDGRKNSLL